MNEQKTTKIAIVTYNRVGEGQYPNGILKGKDIELHISQNSDLSKWAYVEGKGGREIAEMQRSRAAEEAADRIRLEDMDEVYAYVGNLVGGERMMQLTARVPAERLNYVFCDCHLDKKEYMISEFGKQKARVIGCECGGQRTLGNILEKLLKNEKIN